MSRGTLIYKQKDIPKNVFVVKEGYVELYREEVFDRPKFSNQYQNQLVTRRRLKKNHILAILGEG